MIDSDDVIRKNIERFTELQASDLDELLSMTKSPDRRYIVRSVGFDRGDGSESVLEAVFTVRVIDMAKDDEDEAEE